MIRPAATGRDSTGHDPGVRSFPLIFATVASTLAVPSSALAEEAADTAPATPPAGVAGRGIELAPYYGVMIVPQSLSLGFVGVDLAYRLGDHFALGVDGAWYKPFDQPEAPNPTTPISVTLTSVDLDFVYLPWPARSAPGHRAGAFEPFVLAGVGTVVTRPVAVVDPVDRHFDDTVELALSAGLGGRVFCTSWLAIDLEARDEIYAEKQEATTRPSGSPGMLPIADPNNPANPSTWYSPTTSVVNALQLRLGVSVFPSGF
jgi:hypothetical protein